MTHMHAHTHAHTCTHAHTHTHTYTHMHTYTHTIYTNNVHIQTHITRRWKTFAHSTTNSTTLPTMVRMVNNRRSWSPGVSQMILRSHCDRLRCSRGRIRKRRGRGRRREVGDIRVFKA